MTVTSLEQSAPSCATNGTSCAACATSDCVAPAFQHDCDTCVFLGRYDDEGRMADLYAHICGSTPTVIARYSSEGPDYASGSCFAYGQIDALTQARLRAQTNGVWDYDVYEALFHARPEHAACYQELRSALPFTVEYQAYTAFEQDKLDRAQGLVRHLVAHTHARSLKYRPETLPGKSLLDVQSRIHKVVSTYRGDPRPQATQHLEEMTQFLWLEFNTLPLKVLQAQLEQ